MLGYLLGSLLVLTVFSPFIINEAFAENFSLEFDKSLYHIGDSLVLSGSISDVGMPIIAVSVFDPDGQILSANNVEISSEQTFSKNISLDPPFYEKSGEYKVKLDYGQLSENYFFLIDGETSESESIAEDEEIEISTPKIIFIEPDKELYTDNDVITITGSVSSIDESTVLIGIFDPLGTPVGFYFGEIDSNLEFSINFLVKSGVNFRLDGTYLIKAHYAETETTSSFEYNEDLLSSFDDFPEFEFDNTNDSNEEIDDLLDDIISEIENIESEQEEKIQDTISENVSNNNSQNNNQINNENNSIIKNKEQENYIKKSEDVKNQETSIINKRNEQKNNKSTTGITKQNNLTVEDIELGKLLNQINLECDSSTFTDTISYYDGMGPALYRLCKFESSMNFFNESLINNPNNIEILVNKGSALGKLGYYPEAILHYDQAISLDPSFLPAKNNKANALANLGNFDEAILLYTEILEKNPNYSTARTNLGIALSLNTQQIENVIDIPQNRNPEPETFDKKNLAVSQISNSSDIVVEKPSGFFEEVTDAFSSLGSLFDFLD